MAGKEGFLYEQTCNKKLQKIGVLSGKVKDYIGHDHDGAFLYKGKEYKIEYKLDWTADLGQATLSYDLKRGRWFISGSQTPEGLEIQDMLKSVGAEGLINSDEGWKHLGAPQKFLNANKRVTKEQAAQDYSKYKNRWLSVPSSFTNDYYAAKGVYYIQIGGLGFYHMKKDPARIGAPKFLPNLRLRFRLKPDRGGLESENFYNYRFTVALRAMYRPTISRFDIERNPEFLLEKKKQ